MYSKSKIRRIGVYVLVALLTFVIGISAFVYWWLNYSHRPSPETFKAKIAEYNQLIQNEIPEGASASQVAAFLDARKIEHSDYMSEPEMFRYDTDFDNLEFKNKQQIIKGDIAAIIHNADYEPFTEWSITMRFYFDKHKRLVAHTVDWVGTSF